MSYEGFVQILCKNGHYFSFNCYNDPTSPAEWGEDKEKWKCPNCGEGISWRNNVDQTNCCIGFDSCREEEHKKTCNSIGFGYIELEIDKPKETKQCKECGHIHTVKKETYKIPEKRD